MNLGTIQHIARYPVKSMRGEPLDSVDLGFEGLPADRMYSFVHADGRSSWPYITGRDMPDLLRCQPVWDASAPKSAALNVRVPAGDEFAIASPELTDYVARTYGHPVRLHNDWRGIQDVAYVSLITEATIRALAEAGGVPADHRRFRMNFVVSGASEPFTEREWVGQTLEIGAAKLVATESDRRCQMITLDPETGVSTPAVLQAAGQLNDVFAGVYATVTFEGRVAVGDSLSRA